MFPEGKLILLNLSLTKRIAQESFSRFLSIFMIHFPRKIPFNWRINASIFLKVTFEGYMNQIQSYFHSVLEIFIMKLSVSADADRIVELEDSNYSEKFSRRNSQLSLNFSQSLIFLKIEKKITILFSGNCFATRFDLSNPQLDLILDL